MTFLFCRRLVTVLTVVALSGCQMASIKQPEPPLGPVKGTGAAGSDFVEVEVFYATDRSKTESRQPTEMYGRERGTLEYGVAGVSIPRRHEKGELESPSWWKFEFSQDPARHVVLLSATPLAPVDFHREVGTRTSRSGQRNALVFVHGFNVTFEDALRRTAQIAYDLQFLGVPITYSWPSQGTPSPFGYTTDETNVEWTEPHLRQFLVDLKARLGADVRVHLVAHSMGNRALTKVLRSLAQDGNVGIFNQVILAAPDIDQNVFERDIAPLAIRTARRTTLYASSQDKALMFSEKVHTYRRAGQSNPPLVFVHGLDTVDATNIDTSLLGHSTFAGEPLLLNDLFMLVRHNLPPADRNLRDSPPGSQRNWTFPP